MSAKHEKKGSHRLEDAAQKGALEAREKAARAQGAGDSELAEKLETSADLLTKFSEDERRCQPLARLRGLVSVPITRHRGRRHAQ